MEKIIAIYGPTTSGKMQYVLSIAKYVCGKYGIKADAVNTDVRKIYKEFVVSQSLPFGIFKEKASLHLFGTESSRNKLGLYEIQGRIQSAIRQIHAHDHVPILVGGSYLHLISVLMNWKEGVRTIQKKLPDTILMIGVQVNKKILKRAIQKNVRYMFDAGLYEEFKQLYKKSQQGLVAQELLLETLGYKEFLTMADVAKKSPLRLGLAELEKVERWLVKNIANYAYHQTLEYKRFRPIQLVKNIKQAKNVVDVFLKEGKMI